jgi:hypothetical protein
LSYGQPSAVNVHESLEMARSSGRLSAISHEVRAALVRHVKSALGMTWFTLMGGISLNAQFVTTNT